LTCCHPACGDPVHFYGREAVARKIIGVRRLHDVYPHFDHMDGAGVDCPLKRERHKYLASEEKGSPSDLPPEIKIDRNLTIYCVAVWAHMYGAKNVSIVKFDEAKELASRTDILRLDPKDQWRLPYALGLMATMQTAEGTEIKLVPRSIVANVRLKHNHNKDDFYVVHIKDQSRFSGPFHLTREATMQYASRNRTKAYQLLTASLPLG
jgi:hypothetical protein